MSDAYEARRLRYQAELADGLHRATCAESPTRRGRTSHSTGWIPWLATALARSQRLRCMAVWAVGRSLPVITYLLDELPHRIVRRTRGGNAYRVLAPKDR